MPIMLLLYHGSQALAIDPRFASRKTKEFVTINETGTVQLSTQVGSCSP